MLAVIRGFLGRIGADKYIHFCVCLFLSFAASKIMQCFLPMWLASLAGCDFSIFVGIIKEFADSKEKGNIFDKRDLCADIIGAVVGAFMSII